MPSSNAFEYHRIEGSSIGRCGSAILPDSLLTLVGRLKEAVGEIRRDRGSAQTISIRMSPAALPARGGLPLSIAADGFCVLLTWRYFLRDGSDRLQDHIFRSHLPDAGFAYLICSAFFK
jgi:hypothetical protein